MKRICPLSFRQKRLLSPSTKTEETAWLKETMHISSACSPMLRTQSTFKRKKNTHSRDQLTIAHLRKTQKYTDKAQNSSSYKSISSVSGKEKPRSGFFWKEKIILIHLLIWKAVGIFLIVGKAAKATSTFQNYCLLMATQ